MKPLKITEAAEAEFAEATGWYRDRDVRVGARCTAAVHKFPYHVVFIELADTIEVVAFAHYRRNPTYFMGRLPGRN